MKKLVYFEVESTESYVQFGLEQYLAGEKRLDDCAFLLWRTRPTLMLGRYQNVYEEIDLDYARAKGIDLVRRASGGGTIYTDLGGYQFSYIQPKERRDIEFQSFLTPLLEALRALGLPVEFNGRNDLILHGKKFSGNAQYLKKDYVVHHGSLLFDSDLEEMARATRLPRYKMESKGIASVRDRVINLRSALKKDMDVLAFKAYLLEALGVRQVQTLLPEELQRMHQLADGFRQEQMVFGRSPASSTILEGQFAGGRLAVQLQLKEGRIEELQFVGDFFADESVEEIEQRLRRGLKGTFLTEQAMQEAYVALGKKEDEALFYRLNYGNLKQVLLSPWVQMD